jgi:plasmid stability protein
MTITLDLKPEIEAELARQAALQGRAIEAVAAALLEQAVQADPLPGPDAGAAEPTNLYDLFSPVRGLLTDDEIDTLFARNRSAGRPVDLS